MIKTERMYVYEACDFAIGSLHELIKQWKIVLKQRKGSKEDTTQRDRCMR